MMEHVSEDCEKNQIEHVSLPRGLITEVVAGLVLDAIKTPASAF